MIKRSENHEALRRGVKPHMYLSVQGSGILISWVDFYAIPKRTRAKIEKAVDRIDEVWAVALSNRICP